MSVKADTSFTFQEFLERVPPGRSTRVTKLGGIPTFSRLANEPSGYTIHLPEIELHCDEEPCGGIRSFKPFIPKIDISIRGPESRFLLYVCKNCEGSLKEFALRLRLDDGSEGDGFKFGELPEFGPPLPPRLVTLIRPQRDLFAKGRRCENQGLGIASFAYYRRVIENQKGHIIDELVRACRRMNADSALIKDLMEAKKETQFDKAVGTIKHVLPIGLLIKGNNPLTLIHNALSRGLHAQTDEECLELATSIRLVMIEFADRLGQVMREQAELDNAVVRLLQDKANAPSSN
jgi:hypothetical protein